MSSTGINRETGKILRDWPHVIQSLRVIFSTRFGERVMRRHLGSNVPAMLGRSLVPSTVIKFYSAYGMAIYQEPRVELVKIEIVTVERTGRAGFLAELKYRPRGHLDDFTVEGIKRVLISGDAPNIVVTEAP